MEDASLKQTGIFESREFEITEEGVAVSIRAWFFRNRYKVPYEHIIREPIEFTLSNPAWRWTGIGALGFSFYFFFVTLVDKRGLEGALISFGFLVAALASFIGYRLTMRTFLRISESTMNLDLARGNPSGKEVDEFIDQVNERAKTYYSELQQLQPVYDRVGQIERLAFLQEKGVITQEEFEVLKSELVNPLKFSESTQSGQYL